jgi:hypothetical protein
MLYEIRSVMQLQRSQENTQIAVRLLISVDIPILFGPLFAKLTPGRNTMARDFGYSFHTQHLQRSRTARDCLQNILNDSWNH